MAKDAPAFEVPPMFLTDELVPPDVHGPIGSEGVGTSETADPSAVRVDSARPASEEAAPDGGTSPEASEVVYPEESPGPYEVGVDDDDEDEVLELDPIGVVHPGDTDGLSHLVVRSINGSDNGVYSENYVAEVKRRQEEAGFAPDGVVRGATWGLVLRPVQFPSMGQEVRILRKLLDLPEDGQFDGAVADELESRYGVNVVNQSIWVDLLSNYDAGTDEEETSDGSDEFSAG